MTDPDPTTITADEIAASMQASGGTLCWDYAGIGRGFYMRWNPARNHYEILATHNAPTPGRDAIIEFHDHYFWMTEDDFKTFITDVVNGQSRTLARFNAGTYQDTAFTSVTELPEQWTPGSDEDD